MKQGLSRAFKHFRQKVLKRNKLPELIEKYIPGGRVLDIGCAAGGLLASVPVARAEACMAALRKLGYEKTVAIGQIVARSDALEPIVLNP